MTDPLLLRAMEHNLAYVALIAADVLLEHARHCRELEERGEAYRPDQRIADDYADALWTLDRCWRNHVRLTKRNASRIVSSAVEKYARPDIATFLENGLDQYRRITLPGYAMSEDAARERASGC